MDEPGTCPTCGSALGADGVCKFCSERPSGPPLTLGSEAGILAVLTAIGVVLFFVTNLAVASYRTKEGQLARQWEQKGRQYLSSSQPALAVEAFQTALRYDPDAQQLRYAMVDALLASGRSEQARSYLLNLWEHQPANGRVNLQLGRIAAARRDITEATRYYHNAIYGIWDSVPQQHRTAARLELTRFLLSQKDQRAADAELVSAAANVPSTPEIARTLGQLFLQANDAAGAEQQSHLALRSNPRDPRLLADAGQAAFQLGKYAAARSYLDRARDRGNTDPEVARLADLTDLILKSDPLDRRVAFNRRVQRAIQALSTVDDRLEACAAQTDKTGGTPAQIEQLLQQLDFAQDKKNLRALRHDPDLLISAASLVFTGEEAAARYCGQPEGLDLALLLIGRSHSEVGQ